jgi:hypothetical protein
LHLTYLQKLHRWPAQLFYLSLCGVLWICGTLQAAQAQTDNPYKEKPYPKIEEPGTFKFSEAPPDSFLVDSLELAPPYRYLLHQVDIEIEQRQRSIDAVMHYLIRIQKRRKTEQPVVNISIPYYFDQNIERIERLRGRVYHSDNYWATLDSTIFNRINLNARYDLIESTPVPLDSGEVVEFEFTIRRAYLEQLRSIPLGFRVPLVKSVVRMENPNYLRYEGIKTGLPVPLQHTIQKQDTSSAPKIFTVPQPDPLIYEYWWTTNQPAHPPKPYVVSENAYRPELVLRLSEFGRPRQYLEDSWELVVAKIRREQNPWAQINAIPDSAYPDIGLQAEQDQRNKIAAIYRYLNEQALYNEQQRAFTGGNIADVFEGKPSNLAAINMALVGWLRSEGVPAGLLYIASRQGGLIQKQLPTRFQLDALVAAVPTAEDTLLLDASDPFGVPDRLPVAYNTGSGLLVQPDTFAWHEINPSQSKFELDLDIQATLTLEGDLKGTIQGKAGGYQAQWIKQQRQQGKADEETMRTLLLDGYPEVEWRTVAMDDTSSNNRVTFTGAFTISRYSRSFRDGLEFRPLVSGVLWEQPFQDSTRTVPVTFNAPERIHMNYDISLPSEVEMPELPKDELYRMNGAFLIESYDRSKRHLRYEYDIALQHTQYPSTRYNELRTLYGRWVELSKTRWMLKRK